MLSITREPQQQMNLFPKCTSNVFHFELEVVNKGLFAEIRLYFLTITKEEVIRRTKKKSIPKYKTILLF